MEGIMSLLDNITGLFETESVDKFRCEECGAVFQAKSGSDPDCRDCGSAAVQFVRRV